MKKMIKIAVITCITSIYVLGVVFSSPASAASDKERPAGIPVSGAAVSTSGAAITSFYELSEPIG